MSGWRNTTRLGSSDGVETAGVSTTAGSSVTSGAISAGSSPLSDSTTTGGSNGFSTGLSVFLTTFFAAGFTVSAGTSAVASATWTRVSDTGALAETGLLETAASSFSGQEQQPRPLFLSCQYESVFYVRAVPELPERPLLPKLQRVWREQRLSFWHQLLRLSEPQLLFS